MKFNEFLHKYADQFPKGKRFDEAILEIRSFHDFWIESGRPTLTDDMV